MLTELFGELIKIDVDLEVVWMRLKQKVRIYRGRAQPRLSFLTLQRYLIWSSMLFLQQEFFNGN